MSLSEAEFASSASDSAWGLDSWIQACANHYRLNGRTDPEFFDLIETHLYSDLRSRGKAAGIETVLVNVLDRPQNASREDVMRVCEFFEAEYRDTSLLAMVRLLLSCLQQDKLPQAVVSFNADTLLHTLLELYQRRDHYLGPPPYSHPKYAFKAVYRPTDVPRNRTPIYHCHGSIKPTAGGRKPPRDSRDRLVFLESEYIRVATVAASWAETLFMFHAQTTTMAFLGFSMSDPNMRRWLALSNDSALQDLNALTSVTEFTPRHIWLTPDTKNAALKTLRNEALVHLGVRPGWIRDWSQTQLAFHNLLAL
ncbi:SIR2 family protein [Caballeronia sp. ATUFL_M2_KS44]|uniref:SIR2 family protein n=1 Tax=Caballeronia sp. ATUFL_M2_KS44 TaxID=2921767 RepID=UPI002027B413|nr:SIR2 family protein [Caballeronia sp. ATUFL_M2_KS44]